MEDIHEPRGVAEPVGVLVVDIEGNVLIANRAAWVFLDEPADEAILVSRGEDLWMKAGKGQTLPNRGLRTFFLEGEEEEALLYRSTVTVKGQPDAVVTLIIRVKGFGMAGLSRGPLDDLDAIIENTYDGLYITDGEARTVMVNKAYERITGIKRAEIIGKDMRDLVSRGVFDRSVSLEVIEKGEAITIMQELRSGKKILVTGSPVFDKTKKKIDLVVTNVRDITELIELKEKLHERTLEANRYLAELDKMKLLQEEKTKFAAKSKKMLELLDTAIKAAQFDSNILITGESGVGKGLMAKLIHETSGRRNQPLIVVNCASIPDDLFESELFGYEPGAFSGASVKGKKGLLEVADKGTVFLDEIGDMSLRLQAKLLRVIEEKEMVRLGSTKTIKLNVRVIAATNQDLLALIEEKRFRQDLYFRLNTIGLTIPPLRVRVEDILPLLQYFTDRLKIKYSANKQFSSHAIQVLAAYPYPGNVRELSNIVEQGFLVSKGDLIETSDLPPQVREHAESKLMTVSEGGRSFDEIIDLTEYKLLKSAVEKYGSTHKAARELGISQSTVVRKMKKLKLKGIDVN